MIAAIVAILFRKFLFAKEASPFVMELPPYRMPTFNATVKHMWFRASMYLKKSVQLFYSIHSNLVFISLPYEK